MSANSFFYTTFIELDLVIFISSLLLTGYVSTILSASQTIRPFFPQDGTLYNTYTTDTIHTGFVFLVHYFIVAPIIYVTERHILSATTQPRKRITAARLALGMLTSTMLAILFVELGKGYVGRLRPSFAQKCLGDVPFEERAMLKPIYSDADCPTLDKAALHDARRSFPSGHAALAVGGAAYAQLYSVYAAWRVPGKGRRMAVYMMGWLIMGFGFWVAASRVVDNAHHVGDVACGAIVGIWAAVAHFAYVVSDVGRKVADVDIDVAKEKAEAQREAKEASAKAE